MRRSSSWYHFSMLKRDGAEAGDARHRPSRRPGRAAPPGPLRPRHRLRRRPRRGGPAHRRRRAPRGCTSSTSTPPATGAARRPPPVIAAHLRPSPACASSSAAASAARPTLRAALETGAGRVIVGTLAAAEPDLVGRLARRDGPSRGGARLPRRQRAHARLGRADSGADRAARRPADRRGRPRLPGHRHRSRRHRGGAGRRADRPRCGRRVPGLLLAAGGVSRRGDVTAAVAAGADAVVVGRALYEDGTIPLHDNPYRRYCHAHARSPPAHLVAARPPPGHVAAPARLAPRRSAACT